MKLTWKAKISLITAGSILILSFAGISAWAMEEQVLQDKYPSAVQPPPQKAELKYIEEPGVYTRELKTTGFIDIQQGYDNNTDLDPNRYKDGFSQVSANGEVIYRYFETLDIYAGLDFFNITYYKYNINNLVDLAPYIGADIALTPDLIWINHITYDYFAYPNYKEGTYSGLELETALKHYINNNLYHQLSYEYIRRWYADRKILLHDAARGNEDRQDDRQNVKYRVGFGQNNFLIRVDNEYYYNDANETFQDYYDYWTYRLRPSVLYFITDKFYTDLSFIYKYSGYKDRRNTESSTEKVHDNTFIFNASFYYDVLDNATIGITYSYSENISNDPFQKYSGSIISGGIYFSF